MQYLLSVFIAFKGTDFFLSIIDDDKEYVCTSKERIRVHRYICSLYEGQSKITESYLITFKSSKIDTYLDDS